jgi:hypothetical protein
MSGRAAASVQWLSIGLVLVAGALLPLGLTLPAAGSELLLAAAGVILLSNLAFRLVLVHLPKAIA